MDQVEPSTSKAKGISELHFNAINNASFRSYKSSNDQSKLVPTNPKFIVTSTQPTSTSPTQLNGIHKSSPSEGSSTDPSSSTSPVLSPTNSRPKHFNSMRSVRSGRSGSERTPFVFVLNIINYRYLGPTLPTHQQGSAISSPMVATHQFLSRTGSYIFSDASSARIFSDGVSVRSLASIGMGSTDGKKMVIRRVPNSPTELLSIVNQR